LVDPVPYTPLVLSRRPGEGRYAQLEREQRWLLKEMPAGVTNERIIVDHYWTGTALRLRMIQESDGVVYKLCQKVRLLDDDPESVKITNIYLSEREFHALSVTPAAIIAKNRWTLTSNGVHFSVDEFKGRHSGLVLAEVELRDGERPVDSPEFALSEVTNSHEYSGGWLASATAEELSRVIFR
jgi:CYTH domain-containing protein